MLHRFHLQINDVDDYKALVKVPILMNDFSDELVLVLKIKNEILIHKIVHVDFNSDYIKI